MVGIGTQVYGGWTPAHGLYQSTPFSWPVLFWYLCQASIWSVWVEGKGHFLSLSLCRLLVQGLLNALRNIFNSLFHSFLPLPAPPLPSSPLSPFFLSLFFLSIFCPFLFYSLFCFLLPLFLLFSPFHFLIPSLHLFFSLSPPFSFPILLPTLFLDPFPPSLCFFSSAPSSPFLPTLLWQLPSHHFRHPHPTPHQPQSYIQKIFSLWAMSPRMAVGAEWLQCAPSQACLKKSLGSRDVAIKTKGVWPPAVITAKGTTLACGTLGSLWV